jgi:S-formylglutathione hydrolase FrmB
MFPLTDSVSSKIWLEGDKDIKLNAYTDNLMSTLNLSVKPLEQHDFSEALNQISLKVLINDFPVDSTLDYEFQSWDSLSDEALINFEQNLS